MGYIECADLDPHLTLGHGWFSGVLAFVKFLLHMVADHTGMVGMLPV